MRIYILFGKAGSGKSFIGDYLQTTYHWLHFDADQLLTEEMKEYIRLEKQMSVEFIDKYTEILKRQIRDFYQRQTIPIVISQALYRNKNRLNLLQVFPQLRFIWVTADDKICYERIEQRNDGVTINYAKEISSLFEPPEGFSYDLIQNNGQALELPPIFSQSVLLNV